MKKYLFTTGFTLALVVLPAITFAQTQITDFSSLITQLVGIVNLIVPLLLGLAVLGFMWGVIKYIFAAGPDNLAEARNFMIFGIIGIAVMLAVWSLALFVKDSFFPSSPTPVQVSGANTNAGDTF